MDPNKGYGETPPRLKKRIREGGPAKGTKLDFDVEEGPTKKQKKDIKPIEKGDMSPPSTATKEDYQKVVEHTRSSVQDELAELGKGRELIKKVEGMPGIQSESDKRMKEMIVENP